RRSFGFRLNLWYSGIFIASSATLFLLAYALLYAAAGRKDVELIENQVKEYVAVYRDRGLSGLRDYLKNEGPRGGRVPFVRLTAPRGLSIVLSVPPDWVEVENLPSQRGWYEQRVWLRVPRDDERDVLFRAAGLPDGSWLLVGRVTDSRKALLRPFRRAFLGMMLSIVALGISGGWLLAHRATRPLREMVHTARSILRT